MRLTHPLRFSALVYNGVLPYWAALVYITCIVKLALKCQDDRVAEPLVRVFNENV